MDESAASESVPDLKDIEVKIGRKTPEGLLKWMREDGSPLRGDSKLAQECCKETGMKSLDEKIRQLKQEMAHLRSVDVKILHQLLAVHEGIEAVKWLMEERSTLTSHCSSLTSSQYSLGEGPDTSWRGSWSSLQDPTNDKLDNISIGSYLDTLADDMDEYCPSSSESVICSTTPLVSENTTASLVAGELDTKENGLEAGSGNAARNTVKGSGGETGAEVRHGTQNGTHKVVIGNGISAISKPLECSSAPQSKSIKPKQDVLVPKVEETDKRHCAAKHTKPTQASKVNGILEKATNQNGSPTHGSFGEKLGTSHSPKLKPHTNGSIDLDTCKMNGKVHLEYDAHWRWVQSQEDVTFL